MRDLARCVLRGAVGLLPKDRFASHSFAAATPSCTCTDQLQLFVCHVSCYTAMQLLYSLDELLIFHAGTADRAHTVGLHRALTTVCSCWLVMYVHAEATLTSRSSNCFKISFQRGVPAVCIATEHQYSNNLI